MSMTISSLSGLRKEDILHSVLSVRLGRASLFCVYAQSVLRLLVKHFAPRRKVVRHAPDPLLDKALHLFTTFLYPVKYYLDESKEPSERI